MQEIWMYEPEGSMEYKWLGKQMERNQERERTWKRRESLRGWKRGRKRERSKLTRSEWRDRVRERQERRSQRKRERKGEKKEWERREKDYANRRDRVQREQSSAPVSASLRPGTRVCYVLYHVHAPSSLSFANLCPLNTMHTIQRPLLLSARHLTIHGCLSSAVLSCSSLVTCLFFPCLLITGSRLNVQASSEERNIYAKTTRKPKQSMGFLSFFTACIWSYCKRTIGTS